MIRAATEIRDEMFKNNEYVAGLEKQIHYVMSRIESAKSRGYTRTCFSPERQYSDEIKQMFAAKGYTFKPTGYVGGVWQLSEDICW